MHAHRNGMNNGDYLFIFIQLRKEKLAERLKRPDRWFSALFSSSFGTFPLIEDMFKGHTLVLGPTLSSEQNKAKYGKYIKELKRRSANPPFNSTYYTNSPKVCIYCARRRSKLTKITRLPKL